MYVYPKYERMGRTTLWYNRGITSTALPNTALDVSALGIPNLPDLRDSPAALIQHLSVADKAVRQSPNETNVGALAMAYHADRFSRQAQHCYAVAQDLDPDNWKWKYYAALLDEEYGDAASAVKLFQEVVEQNPDFALAWLRLGRGHFKLNQFKAADHALHRAIATDKPTRTNGPADDSIPISIYAWFELARIAVERQQLATAREILENTIGRRKDFGPGRRLMDHVVQELGGSGQNVQSNDRLGIASGHVPPADPMIDALARLSHSSTFLLKQADLASNARRFQWAEYLCRRAVQINGSDPDVVGKFAMALIDNRSGEAPAIVQRYLTVGGPEFPLNQKICLRLILAGQSDLALQCYREVDPDHAEAHYSLGNAFMVLEQSEQANDHYTEQAIDHYKKALGINPDHAEADYNLGNAFMALGQSEQAIEHYQNALRLNPDHVFVQNSLAWVLATVDEENFRDPAEAVRLANRACELTEYSQPHFLDTLAVAYAATGDFSKAIDISKKALSLIVDDEELTHEIQKHIELFKSNRVK